MKRCTRCIFPETLPGIEFDEEGVCNHCRDFKSEDVDLTEVELKGRFDRIRRIGSKYDAVVPLSGGRDSTYALYLARKVYGLNVLAVNYDNEFQTSYAKSNMESASRILDVDLVVIRSKRDIAKKVVKQNMLCSTEKEMFGVCRACSYGYRSAVFREVKKRNIPAIIWGGTRGEKTTDISERVNRHLKGDFKKKKNIHNLLYEYYFLLQRTEFPVEGNPFYYRRSPTLKDPKIDQIYIYDYLGWDREKIKKVINEELNWKKPDSTVSTWRIDCTLTPLINYCYLKLYGCTKACFGYHKMINYGTMERELALKQELELSWGIDIEDIRRIAVDEIGISEKKALELIG